MDHFELVNVTALDQAITLLFGDTGLSMVQKTYAALDEAMAAGAILGADEGRRQGYAEGLTDAFADHADFETVDDVAVAAFSDRLDAAELVIALQDDDFQVQRDSGDEQEHLDGCPSGDFGPCDCHSDGHTIVG